MKKRSFRSTFVSVILVITVAISIVNLAVYGINIKKIRQVEVLKMKTAGERIDDMITISLNNIKGLKQICCTDNYARNILLKNNEKNDIGTKFENQNYMDNALKHIASMDTLILRATIVNKYGNIYCTDTSIPEEYVKTIRNMTKEWMLFEGKEDEYYYGGLQGDNANILTFLYPLHTYGNTPIALLAVDINYKTFQSILENAFYENSGECFILTGEQELFHIGEDLYQKEEKGYIFDKSQKMMKENLIVDTFQSKGKNFYISSRQNMLSGWKIIQVIPEERLFEEVDQKIKWNSIFLLGALILVVSFSIYYTKKIIEPLEEFCKKISHTKGDQLQIINLEHMKLTREIANVIENYNEMANKMNEYLVREIIYDKNQRKIQSKMLRYQINPHFLYNTLNLIASMGELSDFPEIVEITKNLSCIMQYNVKGSRFVSLKTEVEMVKAYLEIQRIRFHDCFSVEYEIERQIEQVRIVKFILQPIVENIFEHGFTMDENDNKIWIKAFKCENDIVILVKDNGCGIDSEKREELNRILCERTRRISYIDEEEKSIGINNVNTRIKNYYGEKYGVKVNKADKGTEIQLLLGIENLEEENKDKVVEDEYYARKSIVKILQESDLDIQVCGEAANGMKAIELLEEYKDIALVITDIQMQKMGGLELASYLHKHIPEIDVLILTAFENFDYAREALRYNVKDYIVKPIYKENLLPPVKKVLEKQEEKSRNQEKIKNYYQWEAAKNYFPVKTIVAHEELYKEFFSYNAIHQEEKFCIVVMQEEELVTDVELVNRIIQEKYRGFIKDFFFSKINEEYVMLLSGIECMDNELIVQEKVESMLSYFCTCKHMNITMGVGLVYSSKEKIYQSYNEALCGIY